jgi:hypothetical protein
MTQKFAQNVAVLFRLGGSYSIREGLVIQAAYTDYLLEHFI